MPPVPLRSLRICLPLRRRPIDRLLEGCLPGIARILSRVLPRQSLVHDQLRTLGVAPAPDLDRRLLHSALREVFRILTGGWTRLDLSPLDSTSGLPWHTSQGTLFLSMHHGQWEFLAGILSRLHPSTLCVARAPKHPLGVRLLEAVRRRHGLTMVHDLASVRAARRHLQSGGLVAFLADQRPPGASRPGTWLGLPTIVTPFPTWWTRDLPVALWTGVLQPAEDHYLLELKEWSPEWTSSWDTLLDQEFLPLVRQSPQDHFGLWHHRLRPRRTPSKR